MLCLYIGDIGWLISGPSVDHYPKDLKSEDPKYDHLGELQILYLTCSIPSVAMALVDIYMLCVLGHAMIHVANRALHLDTSVGSYPIDLIWLSPYWDPLDLVCSYVCLCMLHVVLCLLLCPL